MLLIKASATITVYMGHHRSLLPALFIMCIGIIIRNNSLVGGRARAEAQTSATERVTLYCTWRPSAMTTRPHGQVSTVTCDRPYRNRDMYRPSRYNMGILGRLPAHPTTQQKCQIQGIWHVKTSDQIGNHCNGQRRCKQKQTLIIGYL